MCHQLQLSESGLSLPQQVREAAAFVAGQAAFVRIREDRIESYTADLLARYPVIERLDSQSHFLSQASPGATAAFVLALDSINFGSGWFGVAKEAGVTLEYSHVANSLKKAFSGSRMNAPLKWMAATAEDCHEIFGVLRGKRRELDALMGLFADHLGVTGQMIFEQYDGEVLGLLEDAGGCASHLAEIAGSWPSFHDVAVYKGADVQLYKRAQILSADMYLAFEGQAPANFADMDELTSFADNMVPHVLRCGGILEYAPALAEKIDRGIMLDSGSEEEIEVRAAGIHAVELMKLAARRQDRQVTSANIDHILWNRGYEPEIYARPSHKTMTVWY